jgi:carbon starvation protein CstA
MARCVPDEKCGRPIFYGAMIGEGIIALIWATLGMSFFHTPGELQAVLDNGGPAAVVDTVSMTLMGPIGGFLAIIGVVVLPITSGDTAFRSARLIIADFIKLPQKAPVKRLFIAVPLFAVGYAITLTPFAVIWRYFGFSNQLLATIVLWAGAMYLVRHGKAHWMASIPATFMTAVCATYLAYAKIGFGLSMDIAQVFGIAVAVLCAGFFLVKIRSVPVEPDAADGPGRIG